MLDVNFQTFVLIYIIDYSEYIVIVQVFSKYSCIVTLPIHLIGPSRICVILCHILFWQTVIVLNKFSFNKI